MIGTKKNLKGEAATSVFELHYGSHIITVWKLDNSGIHVVCRNSFMQGQFATEAEAIPFAFSVFEDL